MFKLDKPDMAEIKEEEMSLLFSTESQNKVLDFFKRVSEKKYIYWDKVRLQEPSPENISKETLWRFIKMFRRGKSIKTEIKDEQNNSFSWVKLDYFEEFEHKLDFNTGGGLFIDKAKEKQIGQTLISRGVIEEAIASSQLEGASTSRVTAKKMLKEGRKPSNHSEQMILNNYNSLRAIEDHYQNEEMSVDLLSELHALITEDTLDDQGEVPHLRREGEKICVTDKRTGDIYHNGPNTVFVKEQLMVLVDFANNKIETERFTHPIIKAIMLHFWIGYLHPFTDGNGRLARLIFYWYLIKNGYWAFMYLPISKIIKKSPQQYAMAYIYSEQDDNDLTYFIDYNFKKIKMALDDFQKYVKNQSVENVKMKSKAEEKYSLNVRQIQLLQYLYSDKDARTNLKAHININNISNKTASVDLKDLVQKGLLTQKRQGRHIYYYASEKIKDLF
ncbi:MAG TPA: Fic family protein [Candidatus Kaiserbacteria bacterium]|nr:Fic family protein [Candidatus Kaiserbacteria bacterium]